MPPEESQSTVPGTFGQVSFPITASLILAVLVALFVWIYHAHPAEKETFKFGIDCATLAAGVLSAYYVGQSLLQGVQQRNQGMIDAKVSNAFRYIERWNSPDLAETKDCFREIIASGKAHDAGYVEEELRDSKKRIVVVEVLNFRSSFVLPRHLVTMDTKT